MNIHIHRLKRRVGMWRQNAVLSSRRKPGSSFDVAGLRWNDVRRLLHEHRRERFEPIGLLRWLVPADAVDAREAHGDAGLVACRAMH